MDFNFLMNDIVDQARKEAVTVGFKELKTPEEVDEAFKQSGTTLVLVNSVCGCAGGLARPAAQHAVHYDKVPDNMVTVFAGQDRKATEKARSYFEGYPPSSPSFALMKDGKCVGMVERHEIEGSEPVEVVQKLQNLFDAHCKEI
ncbi:BrxA/BrxB family bacilliredoxin [Bacillus sp. Marseille-P3661]|uniref:BrxA/BrxB family bacilliredoxin n=1 Tax=Bacillus sp. Marseille-P3661 TaxID=1936234 RepID=UPI000C866A11|nr:BrxA/BrxB family bacilliredoxin [Bacillus sp. Marseille-P3661]